MNKKLYLIFASSLLFANTDIVNTLNNLTIYATENQINLEKAPKNLDIINRDFILKSGARTLIEVLEYLPGIEIAQNSAGKKQIIVRGNKSRYRDKIKFLINGIDVTNDVYNNQFYFYNFPASLIKRIEFSKTPDAIEYGENAFLGVINIITLNKYNNNNINIDLSNKKLGLIAGFNKIKNLLFDYHFYISDPNIQKTSSFLVDLNNNSLTKYRIASPDEYEKNIGVGIVYKKSSNTLRYRIEYYKYGSFFGVENLIPLKKDKNSKTIYQYLNFQNKTELNDYFSNKLEIGLNHFVGKGEYRLYPYDFNTTIDNNPDNDIITGAQIKEYSVHLKNKLIFANTKHITKLILELKYVKPYDYYYLNYIPSLNNKTQLTGKSNFLKEDINRKIFAIGFQDLYSFNDNLSFIYGYRYDHYNDFGSNNSYKIGGVWAINNKTTFKLLYNNAFRAPSLIEVYSNFYGNENLKPEKINMLEFIWLQKIIYNTNMKFTLYKGKNKDFIGRYATNSGFIYKNLGDYDIKGFEIEVKSKSLKNLFAFSYSYNNNKAHFSYLLNNVNYYSYNYTRNRMIKMYDIYSVNNNFSFFISSIYGSKIKLPFMRDINEYFTINTNIAYKNKNDYFVFGVNNLTNHNNYDVALPNSIINNRYIFIIKDGRLPKKGREFYINFIKKW